MKCVGIIPSYRPDEKLQTVVSGCVARGFLDRLYVVDDGSGDGFREVFNQVQGSGARVSVLHLAVNSGMGGAIKFGLQKALFECPDAESFVVFDADGQHLPEDVEELAAESEKHPGEFILGVRNFHDPALKIPFRSRFGNRVTEIVFRLFMGRHVTDTQSGLRCYPRKVAERVTQILSNRYEFQLEALIEACAMAGCREIPIQTVYEDGNRRSHFNPILDSLRIYAVFLRFVGASLICSAVDYVVFAAAFLIGGSVIGSLVTSRIVSVSLNFVLNRKAVFRSRGSAAREAFQFFGLAVLLFLGSYFGIRGLGEICHMSPLLSKILVEIVLFCCSFVIQRFVVFPLNRRE